MDNDAQREPVVRVRGVSHAFGQGENRKNVLVDNSIDIFAHILYPCSNGHNCSTKPELKCHMLSHRRDVYTQYRLTDNFGAQLLTPTKHRMPAPRPAPKRLPVTRDP